MKRWMGRAALSVLVAAVLFWMIPFRTVWESIRQVSVSTWTASLAIFLGGHWLNALKLRLFIGRAHVPARACVQAQYVGLAANVGLPGVAGGDLVRAAYLVPAAGARRVAVGGIADRLVDTAILGLLILVAVPFAGVPPRLVGVLRESGWWLLAAAGVMVLTAVVAAVAQRRSRFMQKVVGAVRELRPSAAALAGAIAISIVVQSAFVLTNVWIASEAGVDVPVAAWFVAWPLSKLIAVLPISLGGLGVREATLVSLLAPYGGARDAVFASGLLWQSILMSSGLLGLGIAPLLGGRPRGSVTAASTPGDAP